jgi:queuosine biosynthesis protein QueD
MKLAIKHYFDAAHQLTDSEQLVTKACARLHGHTYAVKVEIENELNKQGFVIDFKAIKNIIDRLDHQYINDILKEYNIDLQPTAENIAIIITDWIENETRCKVIRVSVCEGYKGEDKASWAVHEP